MKSLEWLRAATLRECLALNEPIDSKIPKKSISLVKASLARNWGFDPFSIKFGFDNYRASITSRNDYQSYKVGLGKSTRYAQAQKILLDLNFPVSYLYPWFYIEALSLYYNENKLTVPLSLIPSSYSLLDLYFIPSELRKEKFYFDMTLLDYYFKTNYYNTNYFSINQLLPFFPLERLIKLAEAYHYQGPKDKFAIVYVLANLAILKDDIKEYLFQKQKLIDDEILDTGELEVKLRIDDDENFIYSIVDEIDFPTTETIIRMWKRRDKRILDIPVKRIFDVFEIEEFNPFDHINNTYVLLRKMFSPEKYFFFTYATKRCDRQEDYYGEQFSDWVIAYGNLEEFKCYTPDELTEAFIMEDNIARYRIPETPHLQFPIKAIKELQKIIVNQNPNIITDFNRRIQGLRNKLNMLTKTVGLNITINNPSDPKDRELLYHFFIQMFEAGMYQRTWKGPGHPYPLRSSETFGSCQSDISLAMTTPLNNMNDDLEAMNPELSNHVKKLACLWSAKDKSFMAESLKDMLKNIRDGHHCVGGYSTVLIETAYYYLTMLTNVQTLLPNFDYELFESLSTHRNVVA